MCLCLCVCVWGGGGHKAVELAGFLRLGTTRKHVSLSLADAHHHTIVLTLHETSGLFLVCHAPQVTHFLKSCGSHQSEIKLQFSTGVPKDSNKAPEIGNPPGPATEAYSKLVSGSTGLSQSGGGAPTQGSSLMRPQESLL
jgi:hypothetical protein